MPDAITVITALAVGVTVLILWLTHDSKPEFDPYEELLLSRLYSKDPEWVMEKTETTVAICRFCGSELGAERKCQGCGAPK